MLNLTSGTKTINVNLVQSADKGKVIGAFGGIGTDAAVSGFPNIFTITDYGNGLGSPMIEDVVLGSPYSIAIRAGDSSYSNDLLLMAKSVKF